MDKELVPELRFEGFTGAWEQRKLGDITSSYSGGTPQANNPDYYNGSIPFIRSAEINADKTELYLTERGLAESSAALVDAGCILYALYGATSGEAGISRINGAINQAILAICPYAGFDSGFLASWLRREKDAIVATYLQGGQGNLSGAIVKDLRVPVPGLPEQKAIGDCLSKLDDLITLHQRKYETLRAVKDSMLDKMFPKEGETEPELRFDGFTGPWEQRKLGELCEVNPKTVLPGSFEYVDLESVVGTDMVSHRREEKLTAPSRAQRLASFGDIFYQTVRPYQKNNYFYELPDKDYVFSTGYAQLRPLCDGRFLFSSLQREQFVSCVLEHCMGTSYPAINTNDLAALPLAVPSDIEEQRLVGSILKPIDALITLHQRKYEKLRTLKSAMLDKMFPKGA